MLIRGKKDRVWAIRNFLRITNKDKQEIPFNLYDFQEEIVSFLMDPTIRTVLIRKYRQAGVSRAILGYHQIDARYTRNKETLILNKDDKDTAGMFNHLHFMDERLPIELQGLKKTSAAKDLHYADTNSSIRIDTAGSSARTSANKGRSATVHTLHVTECDYIENLDEIIQGAVNSVPESGKIIFESTSRGPRGAFHGLIQGVKKRGQELRKGELWRDGDTVFLFISALPHPEYRRPVPLGFELSSDEDEHKEEQRILDIGLARGMPIDEVEAFICFRRWKINQFTQSDTDSSQSPVRKFKLEFPVAFEDTIEAAGSNFFNPGIINAERAYVEAVNPLKLVKSITRQPGARPLLGPPSEKNRVNIWTAPEFGYKNRYFAFADVAQGLVGSDFDNIYVLDRMKGEIVASAHGLLGETHGVPLLLAMAEFYDTAWLSWDITGAGAEWRPRIKDSLYPKIFSRREVENIFLEPEFMGLVWTGDIKSMACAMLRSRLTNKSLKVWDLPFFDECLQFGFDDKGNGPQAASGFNDDRVSSAAGCLWQANNLPICTEAEVKPKPFHEQGKLEQRVHEIRMAAARPEAKGNGNWD
ncbi:MAG: hypothetical protein A3E01_00355 [Gammaproteobacteria bacterium RIFCSPHIGHO2_12_FULL_63_22]|nr:MAG: hypothetical protein A3E01_00355 [Gammaproteobacteria bacterium RIFCSPHIGHO2_12_FULL_63_22]